MPKWATRLQVVTVIAFAAIVIWTAHLNYERQKLNREYKAAVERMGQNNDKMMQMSEEWLQLLEVRSRQTEEIEILIQFLRNR